MKDFFVSYNRADKAWAEWIAWTLEAAQYTTIIQAWDFPPGGNFVLRMQEAALESRRTLAVLSENYLAALFTQPEWAAAFASDPTGTQGTLLPVRVAPCQPPGLLKAIVYCDLVGLEEPQAKEALIDAVRRDRRKPSDPPAFPSPTRTAYPASEGATPAAAGAGGVSSLIRAAQELHDILQTTYTTFVAQARVRNNVHAMMRGRLKIRERYQYEQFFSRYYSQMNEEELHLHRIIRAYTAEVLSEYNTRALEIVEQNPGLGKHISLLDALKQHLIVWLGKYRGVFLKSPHMCLVYVGVEEKVPFPRGIEEELRLFLSTNAEGGP